MDKKLSNSPQYVSLIAHQLKAPISSAMFMLQTLLGEMAGPLAPKQRELLEKVNARCQDYMDTARRLMDIARALDQPETLAAERVELAGIAHKARLRYAEQAFQRRIDLSVRIDTDNRTIRGHESALTEALEALIHNALKYTPDHGRIQISVSQPNQNQTMQMAVEDSGIGIPQKDWEKVFEPFYRTVEARHSTRPGSGLGLAFVKAIVEAVGGTISVDRSALGGARFLMTFPVLQNDPGSSQEDSDTMPSMKVVILGGSAAGPKVASKVFRLMPNADITILDQGQVLSYAGCGLPYYISGVVRNQSQLISSPLGESRDPIFAHNRKNIHVLHQTEALEIDGSNRRIRIRPQYQDRDTWLNYDKLVLATGAQPIIPDLPRIHLANIFSLHGVSDAEGIRAALERGKAHDVIILGGGLIGIEITEALVRKGCRVTIIESRQQILRILDWEMARLVENHLESQGVKVLTNTRVKEFQGEEKVRSVLTDKGVLPADMVVMAVGVQPNISLAQKAGLKIGTTGAIHVNEYLQTSNPDIYAAGDCIESVDFLTGKPSYVPLGSNANRQGRIAAVNICGGTDAFPGVLRSMACKVLDYTIARSGLTETEAQREGFDVISALVPGPDKEPFVPGAKLIFVKVIVDRPTRRLLGAQAIGPGNADKRIDLAAVAIHNRMTIDQLANMDLCYAPQYSLVMDNVITAANIARNKLDGQMVGISPMELYEKMRNGDKLLLLDVRTPLEFEQSHLPNSTHIPLGALCEKIYELPHDKEIVALCNYSLRGYEAQLILRAAGFQNVRVLDGGLEMWPYGES